MWRPPEFYRPPPCPVFEPTEEQFKDPLAYISSIRAEGEKFGIVKIRPPPSFQPPFALSVEDFKFRPRRQRINELSACTRIRSNFLERLSKFWELQGIMLKIPRVENEILCLYTLHNAVQDIGGFSQCCQDKKWGELATTLGYTSKAGAGSALRNHYEKILYPFDVLMQNLEPESKHPSRRSLSSKATLIRADRKKLNSSDGNDDDEPILTENDIKNNKELEKLKLIGPGPKMIGLGIRPTGLDDDSPKIDRSRRTRVSKSPKTSPMKRNSDVELKCIKCGSRYKFGEVLPKLFEVPKGDWHCPDCMRQLSASIVVDNERFGFESSEREYTLREFGERADEFKREYFNLPPFDVELDVVEREFWRICDDLEEELTVEYGADIQALNTGSGFSSRFNPPSSIDDKNYKKHPWNLVNLPVASKSVLQYIEGDISGVKVPWLYVGMCFSAFAWHTEDHWTYSINYHHWGEPKVWYGAPRSSAAKLEKVFRQEAGDLFVKQRDLMHHITTTISPAVLKRENVEMCRAVQCPGEFIITFPRGYHAGFNAGLNFCEAVNFCPPDWFPIGREALSNYRQVQRYNIFSQDELTIRVAKLATSGYQVESSIITAAHRDLSQMILREEEEQSKIIKHVKNKVKKYTIKQDTFCGICQTSVYCSFCMIVDKKIKLEDHEKYEVPEGFVDQGIEEGNERLWCNLCAISRLEDGTVLGSALELKINCGIDDLKQLRDNMKNKSKEFINWSSKIQKLKDGDEANLSMYQELLSEGSKFEITREYQELRTIITEAQKFDLLISEIFVDSTRPCMTRDELSSLCTKVLNLPFKLKNSDLLIKEQQKVDSILDEIRDGDLSNTICEVLIEREKSLKVDVKDMSKIHNIQKLLDYLPRLRARHESIEDAQNILDEGSKLVGMDYNKSTLKEFKDFEADIDLARRFEAKASSILDNEDEIEKLDEVLDFEDNLKSLKDKIYLESCEMVSEEIQSLKLWQEDHKNLIETDLNQSQTEPPLSKAKSLLNRAKRLKFGHLCEEVEELNQRIQNAEAWIEKLSRVFIKRNQCNWSLREGKISLAY